jgi:hypothetical protein
MDHLGQLSVGDRENPQSSVSADEQKLFSISRECATIHLLVQSSFCLERQTFSVNFPEPDCGGPEVDMVERCQQVFDWREAGAPQAPAVADVKCNGVAAPHHFVPHSDSLLFYLAMVL